MKVAIIGAGISGSLLAHKLHRNGVDVTVIEKSRGRGGRMATKRLSWGHCDMGAQYFTIRNERLKTLMTHWQSDGLVAPWLFQPSRIRGGVILSSFDKEQRYVALPEMNTLAKSLLEGVKVSLNTKVHRVSKGSSGDGACGHDAAKWHLWDDNNDLIGIYDWVISTLPAEQSAALFETESDIASHIPKNVHAPCWAVALATKGHVSKDIQGVFGEAEVSWFARQSHRPGREIGSDQQETPFDDLWNIHFSPEFTERNAGQSALTIENMAFDWLNQTLTENDKTEGIVAVEGYCHFWRFARISEQYQQQINDNPSGIIMLSDRNVGIIGDWTCGGRVEGALLSALQCYDTLAEKGVTAALSQSQTLGRELETEPL